MSALDPRTPDQRLSDEAARWRKSCQEARAALAEANRLLLGMHLREWLRDPSDFEINTRGAVIHDRRGAIMWERVDQLLAALLAEKPHLAAPGDNPFRAGKRAVEWFSSGTD